MKYLVFVGVLLLSILSIARAAEQVTPIHTAVNVTTTTTAVVTTTVIFRRLLILINDSDETMYCNLAGAAAVLNQGIRLNSAGGNILMDVAVTKSAVNCIHGGTGNKVILVTTG